jgi:hypothetical protein
MGNPVFLPVIPVRHSTEVLAIRSTPSAFLAIFLFSMTYNCTLQESNLQLSVPWLTKAEREAEGGKAEGKG